jgi:hypothetical protein
MAVAYSKTSPYYLSTVVNNSFLDVMINRPVPIDPADQYWTITPGYNLRPDLLAYDLYNDAGLWWVFAQRNPNRIKDPFFDFTTGTAIYIPQYNLLKTALGL